MYSSGNDDLKNLTPSYSLFKERAIRLCFKARFRFVFLVPVSFDLLPEPLFHFPGSAGPTTPFLFVSFFF